MGDSFQSPVSRTNSGVATAITSQKGSQISLVASRPKSLPHISLKQMPLLNKVKIKSGSVIHVALFLLKIGALETVRRISKARCPFVWSGLQALQAFCYPPLKWLQRWDPFRNLIKGMQVLSEPLLVLSIAATFSDQSGCSNITSDITEDSHILNDSHAVPESHSDLPSIPCAPDARINDEAQSRYSSRNWLLQLYEELENQAISLPERINEDELHRFHTAANGDFSRLLSSVKKTIRWRETYRLLSGQELETWSSMVFWHGFDLKNRPCLVVRLGLACINLPPSDRSRFAQAIVSQVEHGVLHLVNDENPQITVLVDCEGLSLRFPMQMMRSCSAILQDNFPNRLGCLFVIQLPPVVRVLAQTFIQVIKPVTRQKFKIEGRMFQKVLSEYLQAVPSYLGGDCTCSRCTNFSMFNLQPRVNEVTNQEEADSDIDTAEDQPTAHLSFQNVANHSCDRVLRSAIIGILIFWVLIALIAGVYDPESRPSLSP